MLVLANAGVPMIALYWPPTWLALAPVIAVEAWYACRVLGLPRRGAVGSVALANVVSTFVGIPLAWLLWAVLGGRYFGTAAGLNNPAEGLYAVTVQAAWLIPYEAALWWMVPAAAVVLTAVFFLVSVAAEWLIMRLLWRKSKAGDLRRWAWQAHLISYTLILSFVLLFLVIPREWLDNAAQMPVDFLIEIVFQIVRLMPK